MRIPNWIHLDLKGAIPPAPDMVRWVDELADAGFNGVVFEYEDRLDWKSDKKSLFRRYGHAPVGTGLKQRFMERRWQNGAGNASTTLNSPSRCPGPPWTPRRGLGFVVER